MYDTLLTEDMFKWLFAIAFLTMIVKSVFVLSENIEKIGE